ncbi:hypothetical protein [Actinomadura welshii]|uniref:hypothetical protein n=1 Tax=Actinomadura welshii TaxID=3103817 RepID=UPI0004201D6B|nr:hypothetical protein [Actinomadura madurae]
MDGVESLREITRDDVKRAIATRWGTPARSIHIVLRNVFPALRQKGVIFRDPTRGLVFAGINKIPPSMRSAAPTSATCCSPTSTCPVSASSSGALANGTSSTWTNSPTAAPPRGSANVTAAGQ